MQLLGFNVFISCQGKALPEYGIEVQEHEKTIEGYVPSEAGKNFEVRWQDIQPSRRDCHSVSTYIDGRLMGCTTLRKGDSGLRWGVRTSLDERRLFQFAPLLTTDDDGILGGHADSEKLGTIEVVISRAAISGHQDHVRGRNVQEIGPVHEKSKKAGSHCVTLGDSRRCRARRCTKVKVLDPRGTWAARFVFRYRSIDLLRAQGHVLDAIGNNASNPSESKKRIRSSRIDGDLRAQKRQKRDSRRPSLEEVKPNIVDTRVATASSSRRTKRGSTRSYMSIDHEDVIDLTLDD